MSRCPFAGIAEEMTASIPKVPEPCMMMLVYPAAAETLAIDNNLARIDETFSIKALSREPRSLSIADFTVPEVVSGPGVNNNLSTLLPIF